MNTLYSRGQQANPNDNNVLMIIADEPYLSYTCHEGPLLDANPLKASYVGYLPTVGS